MELVTKSTIITVTVEYLQNDQGLSFYLKNYRPFLSDCTEFFSVFYRLLDKKFIGNSEKKM